MAEYETVVRRTNLEMPAPLYGRVADEAIKDRRTIRPELVVLIEEALDARDRKAGRK